MARRWRVECADAVYHVMNRTDRCEPISKALINRTILRFLTLLCMSKAMKRYSHTCLLLPVLWLASCSPDLKVTVHDEDAAALVASNFLHTAFYLHKPGEAYDTTHPQFK